MWFSYELVNRATKIFADYEIRNCQSATLLLKDIACSLQSSCSHFVTYYSYRQKTCKFFDVFCLQSVVQFIPLTVKINHKILEN